MSNSSPLPKTSEQRCDVLIVGAGLSGGLIAMALASKRPELQIMLIDAGGTAGGNHIWSFFDSDVSEEGRKLLAPLVTYRWEDGHEVRFPAYTRTMATPYNSISSSQFDGHLRSILGESLILNAPVTKVTLHNVMLASGETLSARSVIDARGFFSEICDEPSGTKSNDGGYQARDPETCDPSGQHRFASPAPSCAGLFLPNAPLPEIAALDCGWQKFVGQTLILERAHGMIRPVIMDATVDQTDGYRFVYVLPIGADRIFVEDTYYTDAPDLDVDAIRRRINEYAAAQGWQVKAVEHEETGVLPVVKGGDFERLWPPHPSMPRAGVRAGLFHPTTGYSLPHAASFALWLADNADCDSGALARATRGRAARLWSDGGYYRLLSTMLFDAAPPKARYRIFERFYRLPSPLIARFYSGSSTPLDKIRILCGKPPVPIRAALKAIMSRKRA